MNTSAFGVASSERVITNAGLWMLILMFQFTIATKPHSHTLEKRSSAPPNPPAGLPALEVLEVVAAVGPGVTGAALVQPPKSSSAATVGVGLGSAAGAPQPPPISFAVRVLGTFIMDDAVGAGAGAGAGAGTGSGVLHAFPPQGSMILAAEATDAAGSPSLGATLGCNEGLERLKAELISSCEEFTVDLGRAGGAGDEESPNKSLERDDDGGLGFEGLLEGEVSPPNPRSCDGEEIEVVRDWGFGGDIVGEAKLSKRSPPADPDGEVTFGAAGEDLVCENLARLAKGEGFSTGFAGGGEVVEGKLNPLKASVKPPIFEDVEVAVGEARSPKELLRSC